jgi:hypothetical protein
MANRAEDQPELGIFGFNPFQSLVGAAGDVYEGIRDTSASIPFGLPGPGGQGTRGEINTPTIGEVGAIDYPYRAELTRAAGEAGRLAGEYGPTGIPGAPSLFSREQRGDIGQFLAETSVPQNLAQVALMGIPAGVGVKTGLEAGETGLRAGLRGLLEAVALDPTSPGVLPKIPGQYQAALDLTADTGKNIEGLRPFLGEIAGSNQNKAQLNEAIQSLIRGLEDTDPLRISVGNTYRYANGDLTKAQLETTLNRVQQQLSDRGLPEAPAATTPLSDAAAKKLADYNNNAAARAWQEQIGDPWPPAGAPRAAQALPSDRIPPGQPIQDAQSIGAVEPPVNTSGVHVTYNTYEKGIAGSTRPVEGPLILILQKLPSILSY